MGMVALEVEDNPVCFLRTSQLSGVFIKLHLSGMMVLCNPFVRKCLLLIFQKRGKYPARLF